MKRALKTIANQRSSPLFLACVFGIDEILVILESDQDFDWNQTSDFSINASYAASSFGHKAIVESLAKKGANLEFVGGLLGSPLHAAAFNGHLSIVQTLNGLSVDHRTGSVFNDAFDAAIHGNQQQVATYLARYGPDYQDHGTFERAVQDASTAGFDDTITALLRRYPTWAQTWQQTTSNAKRKALEGAIFRGQVILAQKYLQQSISAGDKVPDFWLNVAALRGHIDIVRLLLDQGVSIEQESWFGTTLRAACLGGHLSTVQILLQRGADVNKSSREGDALQAAAIKGHVAVAQELLRHGAKVAQVTGIFGTPLQAAAYHGHSRFCEVLLDAGATPNGRGVPGDAFQAAVDAGKHHIIRLFFEKGFSPNSTTEVLYRAAGPTVTKQTGSILRNASPSRRSVDDEQSQQLAGASTSELMGHPLHYMAEVFGDDKCKEALKDLIYDEDNLEWPIPKRFALEAAASHGHEAIVEILYEEDEKRIFPKNNKSLRRKALVQAAGHGHVAIVKSLLALNDRHGSLEDVITIASVNDHLNVLNALLDYFEKRANEPTGHHEDISDSDPQHPTYRELKAALIASSKTGNYRFFVRVMHLIMLHQEESARDLGKEAFLTACESGCRPLLAAVWESHLHVLLSEDDVMHGFVRSCTSGQSHVAEFLMGEHIDQLPRSTVDSALIAAAGNGWDKTILLLVRSVQDERIWNKSLNRALAMAAQNGHEGAFRILPKSGADAHSVEIEPEVPLDSASEQKISVLQACLRGFERFTPQFKMLRETYDDEGEESEESEGRRTWETADEAAQTAVLFILLDLAPAVNEQAGCVIAPLHTAAKYCSTAVIHRLISCGADVNADSACGSVLRFAVSRELSALTAVEMLVDAGATLCRDAFAQTSNSIHPLIDTALDFFDDQLPQGADNQFHDFMDGRFLQSASIREILSDGPGAVIRYLLEKLPRQQAHDGRFGLLLQMVAFDGDLPYLQLLIQRGVNVNAVRSHYGTALQAASRIGNIEIMHQLLQTGADPNLSGGAHKRPVFAAIESRNIAAVSLLIDYGAAANITREIGFSMRRESALNVAVRSGCVQLVRCLLEAGADANSGSTGEIEPPLINASGNQPVDLINLLIGWHAEVNQTFHPDYGQDVHSSLHAACRRGELDIVKLLLSCGAVVDVRSTKRSRSGALYDTPLCTASRFGHLEVVQTLINNGASVNLVAARSDDWEEQGMLMERQITPISVASSFGHVQVVRVLLAHSAKISVDASSSERSPSPSPSSSSVSAASTRVRSHDNSSKIEKDQHILPTSESELNEVGSVSGESDLEVGGGSLSGSQGSSQHTITEAEDSRPHPSSSSEAESLKSNALSPLQSSSQAATWDAGYWKPGLRGFPNALDSAVCAGQVEVVETLLEHIFWNDDESFQYRQPFHKVCERERLASLDSDHVHLHLSSAAVRKMFKVFQDYVPLDSNTLVHACVARSEELMPTCLNEGVDINNPDADGKTPLHVAALKLDLRMVQYLLDRGADANIKGRGFSNAFFAAIEGCKLAQPDPYDRNSGRSFGEELNRGLEADRSCGDILKSFANHGAHVNGIRTGQPIILHDACAARSFSAVKLLLERGYNPNIIKGQWETPLLATASTGQSEIVNLLINYGADPEYTSEKYGTPLYFACKRREAAVIKVLMQHGVDPNNGSSKSLSPLRAALKRDYRRHRICTNDDINDVLESFVGFTKSRIDFAIADIAPIIKDCYIYLRSDSRGFRYLQELLAQNRDLEIPDKLKLAAIKQYPDGILPALMEHCIEWKTTEAMLINAPNYKAIDILLTGREVCRITNETLRSRCLDRCFRNDPHEFESLWKLIMSDEHMQPDEDTALIMLDRVCLGEHPYPMLMDDMREGLSKALDLCWERNPSIEWTAKMLETVRLEERSSEFVAHGCVDPPSIRQLIDELHSKQDLEMREREREWRSEIGTASKLASRHRRVK